MPVSLAEKKFIFHKVGGAGGDIFLDPAQLGDLIKILWPLVTFYD